MNNPYIGIFRHNHVASKKNSLFVIFSNIKPYTV